MKIIEKRVYYVSARERVGSWIGSNWGVDVLASSVREARYLGIAALEQKGLINRRLIHKTSVHESGTQIWTLA